MRKIFGVLAAGCFMIVPFAVSAAPYGTAGCGLGAIVFGDQAGIMQVFAATTNGTSANQTFGITFGTSNCVDTGATASVIDQEVFVKMNYASLMRDTSAGNGEYLSAFATLLGCEAQVHSQFFDMAQKGQPEIFTEGSEPSVVLHNFKHRAAQDEALRASCTRL